MYSSCCNPATSRIEYSDNFFQEKSLVNDTPISWNSQFRVKRCATATVSFMFVNVFQIHLYITVEIFSHQQSHGVFFLSPGSKYKGLTLYLVTIWWVFSLQADLLDGEIQLHYRDFYEIDAVLSLLQPNHFWFKYGTCLTRAKKWQVERRMLQGSDKVIRVYPTNHAYSVFAW